MPSKADEDTWFTVLGQLHPVTGYLLVGAGSGRTLGGFGLEQAPRALLVEAEESRLRSLEAVAEARPGWSVRSAVVAADAGPVVFHRAGSPNESGLVAPVRLNRLWPNLGPVAEQERAAIDLAALVAGSADDFAETVNWLHVDCLPARAILSGAGALTDRLDVIVARALLDAHVVDDGADLGLEDLDRFLAEKGFRSIAVFPERNPGVVQAVFVRDTKRLVAEIRRECTRYGEIQRSRLADLEGLVRRVEASREALRERMSGEIEALRRTLGESSARDIELTRRIAVEADAKNAALSAAERCAETVEALTRARDDLTAAAEARRGETEALTRARDDLTAAAEARASEIAGLKRTLEDASAELASWREEAGRAEKLVRLRQADLDDLRRQYAVLHDRAEAREDLLAELRANLQAASELLALRKVEGRGSRGEA